MLECVNVETISWIKNSDASRKYSIIWLHGLGADGNDFVPIAKEIEQHTGLPLRFIFPHAPHRPVTLNNGYVMPAWYDITGLDIGSREDKEGLEETHKKIVRLIQAEIEEGVLPQHIFLGGFSQGGAQAIYSGLRYSQQLAGIIVFSGYLPFYKNILQEIPSEFPNHKTPIFWAQGNQDTVVLPVLGEVSVEALKSAGLLVDFHTYPMGHTVCEEEIKALSRWMSYFIHKSMNL